MTKEEHWKYIKDMEGYSQLLANIHNDTWNAAIASTKPEKPWPQEGDVYWYWHSDNHACKAIWSADTRQCHYRREQLGIAKTEDEIFELQKRKNLKVKILQMLKDLNGDWIPDYVDAAQEKWSIRFIQNVFNLCCDYTIQRTKHVAKSEEIWREIIDKFGEDEVAEALEVK